MAVCVCVCVCVCAEGGRTEVEIEALSDTVIFDLPSHRAVVQTSDRAATCGIAALETRGKFDLHNSHFLDRKKIEEVTTNQNHVL